MSQFTNNFGSGKGITKALWRLDGNSRDFSGNGNNGTDTNITYPVVNGRQVASFNGTNSYISLPSSLFGVLPSSGSTNSYQITISLWFKTTSLGVLLGQQNIAPLGVATGYVPAMLIDGTGKARQSIFWHNSAANQIKSTVSVNDNIWHNWVAVYDNGTEYMFIDGLLIGSQICSQYGYSATLYYILGTGYSASIWDGGDTGYRYFNGSIKEVRVENRVWSTKEVSDYYNNSGFFTPINRIKRKLSNLIAAVSNFFYAFFNQ